MGIFITFFTSISISLVLMHIDCVNIYKESAFNLPPLKTIKYKSNSNLLILCLVFRKFERKCVKKNKKIDLKLINYFKL